MSALIGLLSSLPQIVSLLTDVWSYLNKISGNDPAAYIAKVGAAFSQLNTAESQEEKSSAAQAIADAIAHMPAK